MTSSVYGCSTLSTHLTQVQVAKHQPATRLLKIKIKITLPDRRMGQVNPNLYHMEI